MGDDSLCSFSFSKISISLPVNSSVLLNNLARMPMGTFAPPTGCCSSCGNCRHSRRYHFTPEMDSRRQTSSPGTHTGIMAHGKACCAGRAGVACRRINALSSIIFQQAYCQLFRVHRRGKSLTAACAAARVSMIAGVAVGERAGRLRILQCALAVADSGVGAGGERPRQEVIGIGVVCSTASCGGAHPAHSLATASYILCSLSACPRLM